MKSLWRRYRTWRMWKRYRRDADYLLGETRRILHLLVGRQALEGPLAPDWSFWARWTAKVTFTLGLAWLYARMLRQRRGLDEGAVADLQDAAAKVEAALKARRPGKMKQALENLDRALDAHARRIRKSTVREYVESLGLAVLVALFLRAFVVEAFEIPSGSMLPTLQVGDHIFVNKFSYGLRVPFTKHPPRKFFHWGRPKRGEVVVFINNKNVDEDFIKRVIAVGGDRVKVVDGVIYLKRGGRGPWKPVPRRRLARDCRYQDREHGVWVERTNCDLWEENLDGHRYVTIVDRDRENRDYPPLEAYRQAILPVGSFWLDPGQFFDPYLIPEDHYFVMGDNRTNSGDSRFPTEVGFVPLDFVKGKALVVWSSWGPGSGLARIRWSRIGHVIH